MWVGTSNGVAHYTNSGFTTLNTSNGLLSDIVNSISSDIDGNIWFLGDTVMMRMQGNIITGFNADYYYPSSVLKCIYSYNNDVYVGTNEDCIKTKIWTTENIRNTELSTGLVSSYITNIGGILSNETNSYASNGLEFPAQFSRMFVQQQSKTCRPSGEPWQRTGNTAIPSHGPRSD
ncbi:MAG: hypothetical protein CVU05_10945 [Bacteroidetes bacterium HGW-Bacteroidetes-21]|nr:MAG: hypothetical protein CVU05_10945 [Bacteroidetes bacterium HGW-Bacteroidetes-21]